MATKSSGAREREIFRDMAKNCVAHRVKRAARAITRLYDDALRDVGLTATQLTLLSAIELRRDLSMRGIGELLVLEQSALSRAVAGLVRRGLVDMEVGRDRREKTLSLTDAGRALALRAAERWREAQAAALRDVGDRAALFGALDRLAELAPPRESTGSA